MMEEVLQCPVTHKPLRLMTEEELNKVNERIRSGQFYFQGRAQVKFELKAALVTIQHTYIYPIIDDIVLLKKGTSIVPKNRTENPEMRITEEHTEAFYNQLGLNELGEFQKVKAQESGELPLDAAELKRLAMLLPKTGRNLLTLAGAEADHIHNLRFGKTFDQVFHMDDDMLGLLRLKAVLRNDTRLLYVDKTKLPFKEGEVDALFAFDLVNESEKETQNELYEGLKSILSAQSGAVLLYAEDKKSFLLNKHKTARKLSKLKPWKKDKTPEIHFHPVNSTAMGANQAPIVTKTSLGSQFS